MYGYPSIELRPGGGDESVTVHNVEEFVERTVDWALYRSRFPCHLVTIILCSAHKP